MKSPVNIKEKAYEKQNRKMRSEYTSETGKKLGTKSKIEKCGQSIHLKPVRN